MNLHSALIYLIVTLMPALLCWRRLGPEPPRGPINEPHIGRAHASRSRRFEPLVTILEDGALARSHMQTPSRFQKDIRSGFASPLHVLDRHNGIEKGEQWFQLRMRGLNNERCRSRLFTASHLFFGNRDRAHGRS